MKETLHIYTRVSTTVQEDDGTSLDTQKQLGIERSKKMGMNYKVWNEGSQSSSKDNLSNRPVLTELLQGVEDGDVYHLYVWNTDRLSRNIQTWGFIRLLLIRHEVHLHTPTGELILSDPQTNLMLGIMSEFSQYDNLLRTERFRLGKLEKVQGGGWKGGPPPYGYELVDGRLEINPQESEWVVNIHEWYRSGLSPDQIKDKLLLNGVLSRRGNAVWSLGSINALLKNTHYDGYWYFNDKKSDQTVRVPCPRICSPELIKAVKESWESRRYKNRQGQRGGSQTKHTYLLSKMLKCGSCGSFYYGNRKSNQTSYYHCGNKTNKYRDRGTAGVRTCKSEKNVRIDTTDQVVWELVKDVLRSSNHYKESIKADVLGSQVTAADSKKNKNTLRRRIKRVENDVQKITESIVSLTTKNLLTETRDLKQVIKKLEEERNKKEAEIQQLNDELYDLDVQGRWVDWLKVWRGKVDDLDALTYEQRHDFLKGVVSEVVIHEVDKQQHRLDVSFQFPWVGDKFVYNDPNRKSSGYQVIDGRKTKTKRVNLLKKSLI